MIINHFTSDYEFLQEHMPELNQHWPLAPEIVQVLRSCRFHGRDSPSRCFKYDDYGAVHYTFLALNQDSTEILPNTDVYTVEDFMVIFFPGDREIEAFKMARGQFDVESAHPSYMATIQEVLETMDLSDHYKDQDQVTFVKYLNSRQSAHKVEYSMSGKARVSAASIRSKKPRAHTVATSRSSTAYRGGRSPQYFSNQNEPPSNQNEFPSEMAEDLFKWHDLTPPGWANED